MKQFIKKYLGNNTPKWMIDKCELMLKAWDSNQENNDTQKAFSVYTFESTPHRKISYKHWSDDLNMVIIKNGVKIELEPEEIEEIIESLPRTVGGQYKTQKI